MPLYSYTTAGSSVIRSLMLLSITSVFSTLMGASVAAGASVAGASVAGASVAAAGGSVTCGASGADVGAAGAHAVRITSARETIVNRGLRFDWYISSSSGKVVGETSNNNTQIQLSKGRGRGSEFKKQPIASALYRSRCFERRNPDTYI